MERRAELRVKKCFDSTIYINGDELLATIIDISKDGIAFEVSNSQLLSVGDKILITVHDEYEYFDRLKTYSEHVSANVKDIKEQENGVVRYGCSINDQNYNEYIQDQLIMVACAQSNKEAGYDD